MRSPDLGEAFALGLESFFNEARLLACFDHPSLVKVYRCWKAHGTAYMAMQYYPGVTLKQARRGMVAAPDEAWLRAFIEPLLDVLELLHGQGVFHRDIAPDNILLLPDGRPVLLDFGSARRVIGDATQSLTAVLKPNFAPIEQYADMAGMRQGPWTDIYALGATVHFMLTGDAPAPAVLRAVRDAKPALAGARWRCVCRRASPVSGRHRLELGAGAGRSPSKCRHLQAGAGWPGGAASIVGASAHRAAPFSRRCQRRAHRGPGRRVRHGVG